MLTLKNMPNQRCQIKGAKSNYLPNQIICQIKLFAKSKVLKVRNW